MANKVILTRNGQAVTLDEYNKTFNTNAKYVKWSGIGDNNHNLVTAIRETIVATLSNIGNIYNSDGEYKSTEYTESDLISDISNTGRIYKVSMPSDMGFTEYTDINLDCSIIHTLYYDYKSTSWDKSFDEIFTNDVTFTPTYEIVKTFSQFIIDYIDCQIVSITVNDGDSMVTYSDFVSPDPLVFRASTKESDRKSWVTMRVPRNATIKIECTPNYGFRFNRDGDDGTTTFTYTMSSADVIHEIQAEYFYVGIDCQYPADGCTSSGWYKKGESILLLASSRTITNTTPYSSAETVTYNAVAFNGVIPLRRNVVDLSSGSTYVDSNQFILTGTLELSHATTYTTDYLATWSDSNGVSYTNNSVFNNIDKSTNFYATWSESDAKVINKMVYRIVPADITLPSQSDTTIGALPVTNNITFNFDTTRFKENDGEMIQSASFWYNSNKYDKTTTITCQTGLTPYRLSSKILINGTNYSFGGIYNPGSNTVECDGRLLPYPSADNNYLMTCYDASYESEGIITRTPITLPTIQIGDGSQSWVAKTVDFAIYPGDVQATFNPSSVDITCTPQSEFSYWSYNGNTYDPNTTMKIDSDITLVANAEIETSYTTFKLSDVRCDCEAKQLLGWYDSIEDAADAYDAGADTDKVLDISVSRGIDGPDTYYVATFK